jgi:hypothetical protein
MKESKDLTAITITNEEEAIQLAKFIGTCGYKTTVSGSLQRRLIREADTFPFQLFWTLLDDDGPAIRVGAAWIIQHGNASKNIPQIKDRLSKLQNKITCHAEISEMHIYQEMLGIAPSPTRMLLNHFKWDWTSFLRRVKQRLRNCRGVNRKD